VTGKTAKTNSVTEAQVREFLKANPKFLRNNPDIVTETTPPERDLGDGILDFQHYLVKNLQKDSKELKSRYEVLVDFCRDNMSVQAQVHRAAMRLIRTKSLQQLLEVMTIDLVSLFDVDVIRLAMESERADEYDLPFDEQNLSGIVAVEAGMVELALGPSKNVQLVADCGEAPPIGFHQIFADCDELIQSCALLKLDLETVDKSVLLAFGVRHKDRFHPGQGIELLHFLAQIVAYQLDHYLNELMI
jgi:uncharacterized protein